MFFFVSNCLNLTCSDLPWIIWCKTISLLALQAKRLILSERRLGRAKSFNPLTSNSNNYKKLNNFFHFSQSKMSNCKLTINSYLPTPFFKILDFYYFYCRHEFLYTNTYIIPFYPKLPKMIRQDKIICKSNFDRKSTSNWFHESFIYVRWRNIIIIKRYSIEKLLAFFDVDLLVSFSYIVCPICFHFLLQYKTKLNTCMTNCNQDYNQIHNVHAIHK